ncbi:60S ribosomal protein L18 [Plecturocebus cupreus]
MKGTGSVQWLTPVISALWEAKAAEISKLRPRRGAGVSHIKEQGWGNVSGEGEQLCRGLEEEKCELSSSGTSPRVLTMTSALQSVPSPSVFTVFSAEVVENLTASPIRLTFFSLTEYDIILGGMQSGYYSKLPRLKCSGMISAHCNLSPEFNRDGVSPCWPGWSRIHDLRWSPTLASQSAGITGMSHRTRPRHICCPIQNAMTLGEKKKGRFAINEVVTWEYTINIHKGIHGVGFKKRAPWALKEIWKSAMKEMRTPDVRIDTRLNKVVWAKGIRNVPYGIRGAIMGVDIHHKDRKVRRKEPKSQDICLRLLVKLRRFLARRTNSTFNQAVLKRLFMRRTNQPPLSLSRMIRKMKLLGRENKRPWLWDHNG